MPEPSVSSRSERNSSVQTRREFLSILAASGGAAVCLGPAAPALIASQRKSASATSQQKKIAILATEVRKHSHAQHFIDRFLEGYGWQGQHYRPSTALAAIYVDQFPQGDLSRDRERRHKVKIYPTIAEALT